MDNTKIITRYPQIPNMCSETRGTALKVPVKKMLLILTYKYILILILENASLKKDGSIYY